MDSSEEYIEYDAYVSYLRKVTGRPADPERLDRSIIDRAVGKPDRKLLKTFLGAVAVVAIFSLIVLYMVFFLSAS